MTSALIVLTVLSSPASVPSASGSIGPIVTEAAFLEAVGPEDPRWVSLEEGVAEAEAEVRRAAVLPNPVVAFGREAPEGLPAENTWLLTWRPPLDGRRGPTREAAAAGLRAARADLAADRLSVRAELRRVYAAWALAAARVALVVSHVGRLERTAEVLRRRAATGEISGLAARRIGLSAEMGRTALARAEATRERALASVRGLWPGVPEGARPELPGLRAPQPGRGSSERPDLVALEERVGQAELRAKSAGRFWSFPELAFGWQTLRGDLVNVDGPVFAVSWSVPLFDRDQGRRAEAEGRARVLAARRTIARRRAKAEVEGARAAYLGLSAATLRAAELARSTEVVVRGTRAAFEAGEATLTDLNDALRVAFAAELDALELKGEALSAGRALEVAVGRPLDAGAGGVR